MASSQEFDEINYKIDLILSEEKRAYAANGRTVGGLGSYQVKVNNKAWQQQSGTSSLLNPINNENVVTSPNETRLLKLYASLKSHEKPAFINELKARLDKSDSDLKVSYLIFRVLYKLGSMFEALEHSRANEIDTVHGYSNLLAILSQTLSYEYGFFTSEELRRLKKFLAEESEYSFELFAKTNEAEIKILDIELGDVNPEINRDRDVIKSLWEEKFKESGFDLNKIIDEIEEHFTAGDFKPNKYSTCMGRVRVLLVEASKAAAKKIAETVSESTPKGEKAIFAFLQTKGLITPKEKTLIDSVYNLTSKEGAHAYAALKEQARITKNIVYEIILLLMQRSQ